MCDQVVAVQVKTIQDAIRDRKQRFNFMGTEISLNPNVGLFITMVRLSLSLIPHHNRFVFLRVESWLRRSNRVAGELESTLPSLRHGRARYRNDL